DGKGWQAKRARTARAAPDPQSAVSACRGGEAAPANGESRLRVRSHPRGSSSLRLPTILFLLCSAPSASSARPHLAVGLPPSPAPHLPRNSGSGAAPPPRQTLTAN